MCPVAHSCSAATHQQHQHTAQHPHVSFNVDGASLPAHVPRVDLRHVCTSTVVCGSSSVVHVAESRGSSVDVGLHPRRLHRLEHLALMARPQSE
jgi:hypothetical protein